MCPSIFSCASCGLGGVKAYLFACCGAWVVEVAGLKWGIGIHKIDLLLGGDVLVVLLHLSWHPSLLARSTAGPATVPAGSWPP